MRDAKAIDATLMRGRSSTMGSNSGSTRGSLSKSSTTKKAHTGRTVQRATISRGNSIVFFVDLVWRWYWKLWIWDTK